MSSTEIISGFRKAIQDLLVPEMRVFETEMKQMREKNKHIPYEMEKRFLDNRITRLETLVEQLLKKAA